MIDNTIFEDLAYVGFYQKNRWMPQSVFDKYIDIIRNYSICKNEPDVHLNVLDLGCGIGQFSIRLLNRYDLHIKSIDSIDSSELKINALTETINRKHIKTIMPYCIDLFDYTTDKRYDVILCSEVIHLIDNILELFLKVYDLLSPGGIFIIRTSTLEQIAQREWYNYFPMCKYVDLMRHKSKELIESASKLAGFNDFFAKEVDESCCVNKLLYIEKFRHKSFSTLHLISKEEFDFGLRRLEDSLRTNDNVLYDYKMTCYILRKDSPA